MKKLLCATHRHTRTTALLFLLGSMLGILWLCFTSMGFGVLMVLLSTMSVGDFETKGVTGHLGTTVHIQQLAYNSKAMRVSAEDLQFSWRPSAIFKGGTWHLSQLKADNLTLTKKTTQTTTTGPLRLPKHLPRIVVSTLDIAHLQWIDAGSSVEITQLGWQGRFDKGVWLINDFELRGSNGYLKGTGTIDYAGHVDINLHVKDLNPVIEPVAQNRIDGHLQLEAHQTNQGWQWAFIGDNLQGHLQAQPLSGQLFLNGHALQVGRAHVDLRVGDSHLHMRADMQHEMPYFKANADLTQFPDIFRDKRITLNSEIDWVQQDSEHSLLAFSLNTPEMATPIALKEMLWTKHEQAWVFDGEGTIGHSPYILKGQWTYAPEPHLTAQFQSSHIHYDNGLDTKIDFAPDLTLDWSLSHWGLTGRIWVPEADIKRQRQPSTIKASPDVQVLAQQPQSVVPLQQPDIDVLIHLGDKVHFNGYGLQANVAGQVRLHWSNQLLKGTGQLDLQQGQYRAFSKVFEIEQGYIQYTGGPLSTPDLHIKAFRRIQPKDTQKTDPDYRDIIVGLNIQGPTNALDMKFFSTPSMPESDILSYMILGKSVAEASASQMESLVQAALAVTQWSDDTSLMDSLPVDEIRFEQRDGGNETDNSNPLAQTTLVVGKHITKDLYLEYQTGIAEAFNTLRLQYFLGQHWMLQGDAATTGSGADIIWFLDQ